jgi:hypothetical protein
MTRSKRKVKEKGHQNGNVPEFELREATNEGTKLIGATCRESGALGEFVDLGVHLGREEADEEVEDIDSEAVRDDVEALDEVHADHVDGGHDEERDPALEHVRGRLVQHVLVPLRHSETPSGDSRGRRDLIAAGRSRLHWIELSLSYCFVRSLVIFFSFLIFCGFSSCPLLRCGDAGVAVLAMIRTMDQTFI